MQRITCGLCGSDKLEVVIDLGLHPLADTFLKPEQLTESEKKYPLQVVLCGGCGHAQSSYDVSPEERYQQNEYSYDSSNSKVSIAHFTEMAEQVVNLIGVSVDDLVVDVGSNVGTLLVAFKEQSGCRVLGVEPALNMANKATENGVPTIQDFFSRSSADKILEKGKPKAITITNAFNHISDLPSFMKEIKRVLHPGGCLVIEVPYMLHLVNKLAFDTIYLEHVSYFSVKPLVSFLKKYDFNVTNIEENDYMGGSVRFYVGNGPQSDLVSKYIEREELARIFYSDTYNSFMKQVVVFKKELINQLRKAKNGGAKIVGIGAATKGNTLMNYCGIDNSLLDFVTDSSPYKVGKYTPGSRIPIMSDEHISSEITHALILPWNIADFLIKKLSPKHPNLKFIIPHMK